MTPPGWLRRVRNAVLFGTICIRCALASPAINVALEASFPSPPLLVELLETAAEENATAYFPLLDRIADGAFKHVWSDEQLYNRFLKILSEEGHLSDPLALSSFKLAASVHSSAPRIEAQYQFYKTSGEPSLGTDSEDECKLQAWIDVDGMRHCSPELGEAGRSMKKSHREELPFDRILGDPSSDRASILYADLTSDDFVEFHRAMAKSAREGKTSYRVRYKPSVSAKTGPLPVHGFGVALDLKRTDYIVIDDRQDSSNSKGTEGDAPPAEFKLEDEDIPDVKPLSAGELMRLGLRASSFIMKSDDPLSTFQRVSQDFPKHAAAISAFNVSDEFVAEHMGNRAILAPAGFNVVFINGVQMDARKINPFDLLDYLRRERGVIADGKSLGLSGKQVIDLLSDPAIAQAQSNADAERYDWRDQIEGGNPIIWLNDIEKDKRYSSWTTSLRGLLQRGFPGQMPMVRRDIHNMVRPMDFSDPEDLTIVVESLQSFVQRRLPVRFGLVPMLESSAAIDQAKMAYHVLDTYGLTALVKYLERGLAAGKGVIIPTVDAFEVATRGRKPRKKKVAVPYPDILTLQAGQLEPRIEAARCYLKRLGADGDSPPIFVNGVAIPRNEDWLNNLSKQVSSDMSNLQQLVFEGVLSDDEWAAGYFLLEASTRRNAIVVPEDEKTIKLVNLVPLYDRYASLFLRTLKSDDDAERTTLAQMIVFDNFDTDNVRERLLELCKFRRAHPGVEIVFVHNSGEMSVWDGLATGMVASLIKEEPVTMKYLEHWLLDAGTKEDRKRSMAVDPEVWASTRAFMKEFGLEPLQNAIVLNGRVVGPFNDTEVLTKIDLETLLGYEQKKRITPANEAIEGQNLTELFTTTKAIAKAHSFISASLVSDVPEGIFEALPTTRSNLFDAWSASETAIITGDIETASVQIVISVDPVSELAQKWIPIFTALSELAGVHMRLFLNPRDRMDELPVKRFYRYVLKSHPDFHDDGSLKNLQAEFHGIPSETLLTMAMDVPPAWLVAPKVTVYDLDNIKLSSVRESIDAVYELEHILIEGHTRDITSGVPPRGAQVDLGTELDPHLADTIIMSNLGYFQFKANPGYFKIGLQEGRSREIFQIDSLGAKGWSPVPGDNSTHVALTSFQGLTLYPRMSRKVGKETEDVLEFSTPSAAEDIVSKGAAVVDDILTKVGGLMGAKSGKFLSGKFVSGVLNFGSDLLNKAGLSTDAKGKQAEINIFSVASGHLYERMLNIMMVSVMRHTEHTVKFWFIEQFLSPSFKSFLPTMAEAYGFDYEMVTYKWPHWLRQQKEKQREIWGYKILFLDVLFPLDLDKVIFVDADQIVRTDMYELVEHDLEGAPYGFTPMCDSRTEMEGFRFWKQGYWKNFLQGLPYHISALYVVDLKRFRQLAAGDRLRQQYHQLSADPNSLANLDQDLPNNMQMMISIHSLPQNWLWCETWCSDASLKEAKTIDLCNNPQTKEPKLDRARRQVPEWTVYDDKIAALAKRAKRAKGAGAESVVVAEPAKDASPGASDEPQVRAKDEL